MKNAEIRALLDKYWEGETSLQEESDLRHYFAGKTVAEEFASYKPLFSFFSDARSVKMNGNVVSIPREELNSSQTKIRKLTWLKRAAAVIVLALGAFFITRQLSTPIVAPYAYEDTFDDPEIAYQEFKKAMIYMSGKINKGVDAATSGINKMEPLVEIIN